MKIIAHEKLFCNRGKKEKPRRHHEKARKKAGQKQREKSKRMESPSARPHGFFSLLFPCGASLPLVRISLSFAALFGSVYSLSRHSVSFLLPLPPSPFHVLSFFYCSLAVYYILTIFFCFRFLPFIFYIFRYIPPPPFAPDGFKFPTFLYISASFYEKNPHRRSHF